MLVDMFVADLWVFFPAKEITVLETYEKINKLTDNPQENIGAKGLAANPPCRN